MANRRVGYEPCRCSENRTETARIRPHCVSPRQTVSHKLTAGNLKHHKVVIGGTLPFSPSGSKRKIALRTIRKDCSPGLTIWPYTGWFVRSAPLPLLTHSAFKIKPDENLSISAIRLGTIRFAVTVISIISSTCMLAPGRHGRIVMKSSMDS